jgi:hypothetical protein
VPAGVTIDQNPVPAGVTIDQNPAPGGATPPAPRPRTLVNRFTDALEQSSADPGQVYGSILSGGVKSALGGLGNIMDMVGKYDPSQLMLKLTPQGREANARINQHIADASDWIKSGGEPTGFWENIGAVGEQMLEYLTPESVIKMAGAPVKAAEVAGTARKAVQATDAMKSGTEALTFLQKHPKIAGLVAIGTKAAKDAATMGAQTYVHTEDPEQAAISGVFGGGVGAVAEGMGQAGRYLKNVSPKNIEVAGQDMLALRSQLEASGMPNASGSAGAPVVEQSQQQGVGNVVQTVAQNATRDVLDRVNLTRGTAGAPLGPSWPPGIEIPRGADNPARLLPAPEGSQGGKFFTLEGPGQVEGRTEMTVQQPASKFEPTASRVPEGGEPGPQNVEELGPTAKTVPDRLQKRTQAYTSATGEAAADEARGGGRLETNDPQEAEAWMRQLEDIQASPLHDQLTPAQQAHIEGQRQQLSDRLGLYHASPYAQRFAPVDVDAAANRVRTFGDAAAQIQASVQPVFQKLDELSDGDFTSWREIAKKAQKVIQSASSMEAVDAAQQRLSDANSAINDLITRHAGDISRNDYLTAQNAWRESSRLDELHSVLEGMTNGIPVEATEKGFNRVFTGSTKALQKFLDKGTNQAQLTQLIGEDGINNIRQMTELLSKAKSQRSIMDVAKSVAVEFGKHARIGGLGGLIGGTAAHAIGLPWFEGVTAGAMTGATVRAIIHDATINPRIGGMVMWAAEHGLKPQDYAPYIARAMAVPMQKQGNANDQSEEQEGDRQTPNDGRPQP